MQPPAGTGCAILRAAMELVVRRETGPPPGAGACHRAGQRPDPLGFTLPFSGEGNTGYGSSEAT
jgi:hypothetical protein